MPIMEVKTYGDFVDIDLSSLHIQYIPAARLQQWWPSQGEMMRLDTSPHVDIIRTMLKHGEDWGMLSKHPYFKERQARRTDHGQASWTDKRIKMHLRGFLRLYKSMKKRGYDLSEGNRKPIIVLKKPLWETRMNEYTDGIVGPEIYDGAHRCTCAYVLGWTAIRGLYARDAAPGVRRIKKFEGKINGLYSHSVA